MKLQKVLAYGDRISCLGWYICKLFAIEMRKSGNIEILTKTKSTFHMMMNVEPTKSSRALGVLVFNVLRERCKKKLKKNLTSVSFAFTHTYTAVKTNSFRFFPQAYMENFKNVQKQATWAHWEGGGGANSPLWPRYHPIGFKTSTLKENCLLKYCWGKKREKK